jgi:hypothetical protein
MCHNGMHQNVMAAILAPHRNVQSWSTVIMSVILAKFQLAQDLKSVKYLPL